MPTKSVERNRAISRAYSKALRTLKQKYEKEYLEYRETKAWGETYKQKHDSTMRYLRFKHPRVFRRLYTIYCELEGFPR